MVDVRKGIRSKTLLQYSSLTPMERECYEGEVQPYRKTDYKPIIYIYIYFLHKTATLIYTVRPPVSHLLLHTWVKAVIQFSSHTNNLNKITTHLNGWILQTFSSRDKLTMFRALVMSQLDYGSQLWSPYLTKHINMIEKPQRSFTRYISGMHGLSYPERLTVLKLYYLQHRTYKREIHYHLCLENFRVPSSKLLSSYTF